jgi:hypothetical protein
MFLQARLVTLLMQTTGVLSCLKCFFVSPFFQQLLILSMSLTLLVIVTKDSSGKKSPQI